MRGKICLVVTAILSLQVMSFAQLRFDAASVKPGAIRRNPSPQNTRINPGGITYTGVTLEDCIVEAYGVKPYQISGPDWIKRDQFDITARAEGQRTRQELMQMLRTLLEERFHLAFHPEQRELPVYALTVAKNGVKLKLSNDDGDSNFDQVAGGVGFHKMSMSNFAALFLSRFPAIGRPVLDKTGLQGDYDFILQLTPNGQEDRAETKRAIGQEGFSLFSYALDQLGLRLEAERASFEVLVIDRAEKPEPN